MKKMWPRWVRTSSAMIMKKKDMKTIRKESKKSLNVNEEYLSAVRTKSFIKVRYLVNNSSSSPACNNSDHGFSEVILDPTQESITQVLESSSFARKSSHKLKTLLLNYFNTSAEASRFCSHLLKNLNQVQSDYSFICQIMKDNVEDDHRISSVISDLRSCVDLENPFSKQDFETIHDKHTSILQRLKLKKRRVVRKIKFIRFLNNASGIFFTLICGLVAAAALFLAAHTLSALLMGPVILTLPLKQLKKEIRKIRFLKYNTLRKVGEQLDVAAKGAYILNRDFDTMSRLVARLQDEIEHNMTMVKFCLERREEKLSSEMLKELNKCEFGLKKQIEELEEHVYLCLVTINRTRTLVLKEISKD